MAFGKLVGAIDEGTTSARFIIFRAGTDEMVCDHQMDIQSIFPQEGWCEQDPTLIYETVNTCIEEAVKKLIKLGGSATDIVAVGITNQRESVVVWNRNNGKPLHNAIIWLDNRTTVTVDKLLETVPNKTNNLNYLKPLCGLPLSTYFSAVKLRWLDDNVAEVRNSIIAGNCMFGTIDTWLLYNLTGGADNGGIHCTDVTNASRTMFMNIETLRWDPFLLNFFGMPENILPTICSSAEVYGEIKQNSLKGVPLTAVLGDQQAALVGQQCLKIGQAKSTYGTGCFLLSNTGEKMIFSKHGLLTTVGYQFGKKKKPVYALEGSVAIAGAAISWMRDNLGLFESVKQVEYMAKGVKNCGDVYFVPAFSGLYAPYWNQEARGVICGLSEKTTSEHIVLAALESVCFQVRDILESMEKDCGTSLTKLMVDGGMIENQFFVQLQSNLMGIDVVRTRLAETTALGAALAAYMVVDPSYDIKAPLHGAEALSVYKPKITKAERDARYRKWKMAVQRSIDWEKSAVPDGNHALFDFERF